MMKMILKFRKGFKKLHERRGQGIKQSRGRKRRGKIGRISEKRRISLPLH